MAGPETIGELPSAKQIQVTVVLRRRAELPDELPTPISRAELADQYGANPDDVTLVTQTVTAAGAHVVAVDAGSRRVLISGSVPTMESLFGTKLDTVSTVGKSGGNKVTFRQRQGN